MIFLIICSNHFENYSLLFIQLLQNFLEASFKAAALHHPAGPSPLAAVPHRKMNTR
jgi:hypothetical protein